MDLALFIGCNHTSYEFGNQISISVMIPVNKWWALLALALMMLMVARGYNKQS